MFPGASITITPYNDQAAAFTIPVGAYAFGVINVGSVDISVAGFRLPAGMSLNPNFMGMTYPAIQIDPTLYGAGNCHAIAFRSA